MRNHLAVVVPFVLASCGVFTTENADRVKDLHRELCKQLVVEQAESAGINVEEAIKKGWEASCMLNVGGAIDQSNASATEVSE